MGQLKRALTSTVTKKNQIQINFPGAPSAARTPPQRALNFFHPLKQFFRPHSRTQFQNRVQKIPLARAHRDVSYTGKPE